MSICIPIAPAVCQKMWKFNIENAQSPGSWPQSSLPGGCQSIDWQGQVVCDSWQLLPAGCHRLNPSSYPPLHCTPLHSTPDPDSDPGWSPPRDVHRTVVTDGWPLMVWGSSNLPVAPGGAWTNDSGRLQLMNLCGSRDEKCIFHNKLKESGHVGSERNIRFFN